MTNSIAILLAVLLAGIFAAHVAVAILHADVRNRLGELGMLAREAWTALSQRRSMERQADRQFPSLPDVLARDPNVKCMRAGERWEWSWTPSTPGIFRGVEITMIRGRIEALVVGDFSIQHLLFLLPPIGGYRPAAYFTSTHPFFPKVEGFVDASLRTFMELYACDDLVVMVSPIFEFARREDRSAA